MVMTEEQLDEKEVRSILDMFKEGTFGCSNEIIIDTLRVVKSIFPHLRDEYKSLFEDFGE